MNVYIIQVSLYDQPVYIYILYIYYIYIYIYASIDLFRSLHFMCMKYTEYKQ